MTYDDIIREKKLDSPANSSLSYERELDLGKTKLVVRLASDRQVSTDREEFLERLKNFCRTNSCSSSRTSSHS